MAVWAIGDLHLSFGIPNKSMDVFGARWHNHAHRIKEAWQAVVASDDLVLIPGDICWATNLTQARENLMWIDSLPGTKVLLKGNHDYWWPSSITKLMALAPPTCHFIHNNSFLWHEIVIAGARLWDIPNISFDAAIDFNPQFDSQKEVQSIVESDKIYRRDLIRLETSLKSMPSSAQVRIAMTHYPPIGLHFEETEASRLLEKFDINICVFGHLHQTKPHIKLFGQHNGVHYYMVACDALDNFTPLKIL